jgi:hypothetical protein
MRNHKFGALMLALGVFANMALVVDYSDARGGRGGGGGGMRGGGGGGMSRGGGGGGIRSSGMSSVSRSGGGGSFSRSSSGASRSSSGVSRSSYSRPSGGAGTRTASGTSRAGARDVGRTGGIGDGSRGGNRTTGDRNIGGDRQMGDRNSGNRGDRNIGSGNRQVNNIGSNNNINIDNDGGWGGWDDHIHHPIAAGMAIGTAAAVTAAAWGSVYYSVPSGCGPYAWGGYSYYNCGGYYLQPQYEGDTVVYVTVPEPGSSDTSVTVTK